jgi:20S proteasome alpha/beta subunit
MTVILAVPCSEGVVLSSDAQATDAPGGNILNAATGFATKFSVDKLYPLGTHIAWGGTGDMGAIQRLDITLRQLTADQLTQPIDQLRDTLRGVHLALRQILTGEAQRAGSQPPQVEALYAGFSDGQTWVLEITNDCKDTVYSEPYAVGSGGTFAKLAMTAVAHFELPNRSLEEAQLIAWRALDGCITASAFGIGHPIRMFTITAEGARKLTDEDERSLRDSVNIWKAAELDALKGLNRGNPDSEDEPKPDEGLEPAPDAEADSEASAPTNAEKPAA